MQDSLKSSCGGGQCPVTMLRATPLAPQAVESGEAVPSQIPSATISAGRNTNGSPITSTTVPSATSRCPASARRSLGGCRVWNPGGVTP